MSPRIGLMVVAVLALIFAASPAHAIDCSPAAWPPQGSLDAARLIQGAQVEAQGGDPSAQWLVGALYYTGQGVPQNRTTAVQWLETAARTVGPAARRAAGGPNALSDIELYETMRSVAEGALPVLVQRDGQAIGMATFYSQVRALVQIVSGCFNRDGRR